MLLLLHHNTLQVSFQLKGFLGVAIYDCFYLEIQIVSRPEGSKITEMYTFPQTMGF